MATFQLIVDTVVRGYHVYKDIWLPETGESFLCRQESDNEHDRYAVAVYANENNSETVGHLLQEISKVGYYFLRHNGSITGEVKSKRRHCQEKGGMEIPCQLTFVGEKNHIQKLRRHFEHHHFSCIESIHKLQ